MNLNDLQLSKLFKKINKTNTCWFWIGAFSRKQPQFYVAGKILSPKRIVYEILKKEIAKNHNLIKKCENFLCVNPANDTPL